MPQLFGRTQIFTDKDFVDETNVLEVLRDALGVHRKNRDETQFLYDYYKGKQPVLQRRKEVRPEICNLVVENRANEIVSFKVGYLISDPVVYVNRDDKADIGEELSRLNGYMASCGKDNCDKELVEWEMICGTAYRLVLPASDWDEDDGDAPFEVATLDPRDTFVIYSNKIGHKPMAAVYVTMDKNRVETYSVYTERQFFEIHDPDTITRIEPYTLGIIPIIEYPANTARLGAFEIVVPLLDAMNEVASNRVDGVEQFIQSLVVAVNCQIPDGTTANDIRQAGMVVLRSVNERTADFKILSEELDQAQTQTLVDYMYDAVLTICGMPNRNGGSSTSDTGSAVIYRDGWSAAETRAKDTETIFKKSEYVAMKLMLRICRDLTDINDVRICDVDIKFSRRITENAATRSTILTQLLGCEKLAPRLAFVVSGLFTDPEAAYKESVAYAEAQERKNQAKALEIAGAQEASSEGEDSDGEGNESDTDEIPR